jgi:hypothetical protein
MPVANGMSRWVGLKQATGTSTWTTPGNWRRIAAASDGTEVSRVLPLSARAAKRPGRECGRFTDGKAKMG